MRRWEVKTLVLALGNPFLSDDSVGLHVARALEGRFNQPEITVMETCMAGLSLLDLLIGYDRVIIIDAIQTREGKVGQVYRLKPDALDATRHVSTPHDVNFATALELGNKLGLALPQQITIFAVEVEDVTTFGEGCTRRVKETIPVVADMVTQELNGG